MNPDRFRQISRLYHAALLKAVPDRSPFVREACGDDESLRREIESLLARGDSALDFLETPAVDLAASLATDVQHLSLIGRQLGGYHVLALLGAGGMGEVYRARDPRLGREVAIKILPAPFVNDADRLRRFNQEVRAAAALNHPNIVVIHSVEQAGDLRFVTMELIEGRTLAELIPRGGLPLDRILKIGIQLADGVSAAHKLEIVHRDLKPANVMVTSDGRVKILDFGLAKLKESQPASDAITALPTEPQTAQGVIIGTVAYMSPEQAEGKALDYRSDLFSLGTMLYEMSTGERPFKGETTLSTITSILRDTPRPVTELNESLPSELARVIRRALVKDPERRYQTAKDLRNDLEEVKASVDSGGMRSARNRSDSVPGSQGARLWHAAIAVLLIAVAIGGGIYALIQRRPPITSLQITQLTTSGNAERPAISPDGKFVAYVQHEGDDYSLWIRQTTTGSNVQIVGPEPNVTLWGGTVTPDGGFVDFVRWQGSVEFMEIWRVPLLGGAARRLIEHADTPVAWSRDSQRVAFVRISRTDATTAVIIADPDGANERIVAVRKSPRAYLSLSQGRPNVRPAWSPDGRVIALIGTDEATPQAVFVDAATGSERVVPLSKLGSITGPAWVGARALVVTGTAEDGVLQQVWRLSYPAGQLTQLTNDLSSFVGTSVTTDGRSLVTERSDTRVSVWVGDGAANSGTEVVSSNTLGDVSAAQVAWAGDRLLYPRMVNGQLMLASLRSGGGAPDDIVSNDFDRFSATSDGRTIVFTSTDGIWKAEADGRHRVRLISGSAGYPQITRDDRSILFLSTRTGLQSPWIVSVEGGPPVQVANLFAGAATLDVSPDGKSLMFATTGSGGNFQFVMCELPTCATRRALGVPGTSMLRRYRWTPDGRGIADILAPGFNIWIVPLDGSPPHQLTHFTERNIQDFAWSHDGQRLAVARTTTTNDIVLLKGLN
jgi:serine/threonine protein kinase/Tol biopolymer transport system component